MKLNPDQRQTKSLKTNLSEAQSILKSMISDATDIVFVKDIEGRYIVANQAAADFVKMSVEEILGQDDTALFAPEIAQSITKIDRQVIATGTPFAYEENISNSQTNKYLLTSKYPWRDDNGNICGIIGISKDITASKRSEQQLRNVLDSLFSFVGVLTPEGILIEANRTALEAANLKPEDVLNKPFAETYWWSYSTQSQARLNKAIAQAAAGETVRYDAEVRIGADKQILIDFSLVPVFDINGEVEYIVPSGVDITEREKSKKALEQSQHELRLITEVIPQQIWTALPDGTIDYISRRWQKYTGISLEQLQNIGWEIIIHPDDLEQVVQSWQQAIKTGKNYNSKARLRSKDGTYGWFLNRARPLRNQQGKIIKWYGTNTSISRIKELEEKLQEQTKDLIQANQLKDDFLAIVSHELRTPLNPILGWSQLLAAGKLDAKKTAMGIEIIERNAKLQAQIIDDLLDVSRIMRDKIELNLALVNLETIIKSALSTVQLAAEAKSIQIETYFEPNIGQVSGDARRLQQIVWNLVSNAIKFTPEGGQVIVKLERINRQAQIQVSDTGEGISPEFLPYVFERFRQAESSNTRNFGGLGLGLAITRHLTELHGGTVGVKSAGEKQGTTFKVRLPLIDTSTVEPSDDASIDRLSDSLDGLKILVVDDETDSKDILTVALEQAGAEVTPVSSANAAIEVINKSIPDLIVSDIGMPEVDGYTMMTQIRNLPQGQNIKAIALSAYAREIDRARSLLAGFEYHLAKPVDIPSLITTITTLIKS